MNNTFQSALMMNGEACGANESREVKLKFVCDDESLLSPSAQHQDMVRVDEITEPKTCRYEIRLKTPLVCEPFSMHVYPQLSSSLKSEWDLIYSEWQADFITEKVQCSYFESVA